MLHERVFPVNKKKVDVAQKKISCRQKHDDAAASKKNIFCVKKFLLSPERRAIKKGLPEKLFNLLIAGCRLQHDSKAFSYFPLIVLKITK